MDEFEREIERETHSSAMDEMIFVLMVILTGFASLFAIAL